MLTASVSQDNFLGSGKQVAFKINTSKVNTIYDISYLDPYYTIDGVSRGYGFSYIKTDASEADISDFDSEQFSLRTNYGIPLTEDDRVSMTLDLQKTDIQESDNSSDEIRKFLSDNGDKFLNFSVTGAHVHDSRNRRMFGTKGFYQRTRLEVTTPLSDLEYYVGLSCFLWAVLSVYSNIKRKKKLFFITNLLLDIGLIYFSYKLFEKGVDGLYLITLVVFIFFSFRANVSFKP